MIHKLLLCVILLVVQWKFVHSDCAIVSRAEWGALRPYQVEHLPQPVGLVIIQHAVTRACNTDEDCAELVRNLQTYYLRMGFSDLGPSFLVGGNGKVYEGPGWLHVGAHTHGYNTKSIAVSFIGDFQNELPTPQALAAAKALIECGVDSGHLTSDYQLVGSRQLIFTQSPGDKLYEEISSWPAWTDNLDGIRN